MKKLLLLYAFMSLVSVVNAQPGSEWLNNIKNSFAVNADKIKTETDISLYCKKDICPNELMYPEFIILTELSSNTINVDSSFYVGVFSDELNNTQEYNFKIINLIYRDQIMTLKVKKNRRHFIVMIQNLIFQEGIFEMDLEEMYQEHGKKDSPNQVQISKFPLEK